MALEDWDRISACLDELLDLDATAREARLLALDAEDPVFARKLRELLTLEAERDDFLSKSLTETLPPGMQAGDMVGPYALVRHLGDGGMGQVWLAQRRDGLFEHRVALKLLRPGFASQALLSRFARERRILARLAHPNIARLIDAGVTGDGHPYLVLEYVNGLPITEYADANALSVRQRLMLMLQVCAAVAHAHNNLIVHRDLKPTNILVTPSGQVHLLDFGIAKLLDDVADEGADLTRTGVQAFTLHYAAPEQLRSEPATTQTDVYALGVILYELLTGTSPYRVDGNGDAGWRTAILEREVLRPSLAVPLQDKRASQDRSRLRRELRGEIDSIVMRCLRKVPEQRYRSVNAFAEDVENFLAGRALNTVRHGVGYILGKFARRHAALLGIAGILLASLLLAIAGMALQSRESTREAQRAQAMQNFLIGLFEQGGDTAAALRDLLDDGLARIQLDLGGQPETLSELLLLIARLRNDIGDHGAALDTLERMQAPLAMLGDGGGRPLRMRAALERARAAFGLAQWQRCVDALDPSLGSREADRALAVAMARLSGRCRARLDSFDAARKHFTQAMQILALGNDAIGEARVRVDIARLEIARGDLDAGEQTLRRALEELHVGDDRGGIDTIIAWQTQAELHAARGDLPATASALRDAIAMASGRLPGGHTLLRQLRRDLCDVLLDLGRDAEAQQQWQLIRAAGEEPVDSPEFLHTQLLQARLAVEGGDDVAGARLLAALLASRVGERLPLPRARARAQLAAIASRAGRIAEAIGLIDQALSDVAQVGTQEAWPLRAELLLTRARLTRTSDPAEKVEAWLDQAADIVAGHLNPRHPLVAWVGLSRIEAMFDRGPDASATTGAALRLQLGSLDLVYPPHTGLALRLRGLEAELTCRNGRRAAARRQWAEVLGEVESSSIPRSLREQIASQVPSCLRTPENPPSPREARAARARTDITVH